MQAKLRLIDKIKQRIRGVWLVLTGKPLIMNVTFYHVHVSKKYHKNIYMFNCSIKAHEKYKDDYLLEFDDN